MPAGWRAMFPTLFGPSVPAGDERTRSEAILAASLEVAERGEQVRSQFRGRDRRGADGASCSRVASAPPPSGASGGSCSTACRPEIHPYDVTVERDGAAEAYDCKWGARGINADVLHQLDDARSHAADEDERLAVALVVFDAERSCDVRLGAADRAAYEGTTIVPLEALDRIAAWPRDGR